MVTEREENAQRSLRNGSVQARKTAPWADRLARLVVPLGGGLFVPVQTYIMALHQNLTANLITTTVAVVMLVLICSVPLRLADDQTFSATVGYAAVLMVFVALTSLPQQLSV